MAKRTFASLPGTLKEEIEATSMDERWSNWREITRVAAQYEGLSCAELMEFIARERGRAKAAVARARAKADKMEALAMAEKRL